ncbi:RraA family protein [Microbacterium halotolerans]|uniref:RraA family protein n=1 Tax=Microbacterium halotolerans TaxID=246613 RepID=UPI000E6AD979|nr:4-carboxy-4-hydroxy-2-oxoadipate aldolase/oxaloacetate decarboxylase [Microbacterium halotolerans]
MTADKLLLRLRALDTCAVSDALDTLSLPGATTGVRALWFASVVVGRARTIQAGPRPSDGSAAHIAAAAIDDSGETDVLVIANDGRLDVSCFGGILTRASVRRGVRGVVIDGACRDIAESRELGFPVFGRAVVPVSARGRIVQLSMDQTIEFARVRVDSGDLVIADGNGVVFVPAARAEDVIGMAELIAAREWRMATAVDVGEPVTDVMHDSKFPTLEDLDR